MAQWMSIGSTHRHIEGEMGDLHNDKIAGQSHFTYARYNLSLCERDVLKLNPTLKTNKIASLTEMDEPENMPLLSELATTDAKNKVSAEHFPALFDLR